MWLVAFLRISGAGKAKNRVPFNFLKESLLNIPSFFGVENNVLQARSKSILCVQMQ